MATKPIIAIDIDDVLADNAAGFVAFSNARWGTTLTADDYIEHWSRMWQIDHDAAEERAVEFHDAHGHRGYKSNPTASPVLKELQRDFDLIIVTSRRIVAQQDTHDWIAKEYPGVFSTDQIHFAGIWDEGITDKSYVLNKGETVKKLGASYLIDDQIKHCEAAAKLGIKALLFGTYGWNTQEEVPSGVRRVKDWQEVLEFFREQTK